MESEYNEKAEAQSAVEQVKITEIISITLRHWPWIILSLVVCVGLALLYLAHATPMYTRTAAVVIKDESQGKSSTAMAGLDAFADMGLLQTHNNIVDEVNKLQSPDVMQVVVQRLSLNKNYTEPGDFRSEVLYGPTLPITVNIPSLTENESASCDVKVNKDGTFTISDVVSEKVDQRIIGGNKAKLGGTVKTSAGAIEVKTTPYYVPGKEYDIHFAQLPIKNTIDAFEKELSIDHKDDKGNTINITVRDASTQRAEDIINTVISVYNEIWLENRNLVTVSTSKFINERLGVIENELGHVDKDISSYQSEHLIPDVSEAAKMYMEQSKQADEQLLELNSKLQMTRYMRNYLSSESNKNHVLPVNSGIGNLAIETSISEYNGKMLERNQMAANSSETHPVVMDLDAQIAGLRKALIAAIDNEITSLDTQIRNLQGSKSIATSQIASSPSQAISLLSMERQQKVKESLYLFLLQKREENELSQAFTSYNTQVITRPNGLDHPTSPVKLQVLAIAFILGVIIPFGVTYLRILLDTKIRGRKDVEKLAVPFLGEIPMVKSKKGEIVKSRISVRQGSRDVINEAFRVLRTNIGFMAKSDGSCSVMMITSFNPGSGKSFIAINLGAAMAIRHKSVLVIDGDLRHCSTSQYVGSPSKGLANYLVGQIDNIDSVIVQNDEIPDLSVLPVGTIPPNPAELLESKAFVELIAGLRSEYDYVIIDCPPIEMMADAQIIEEVVDRTIFIVRAGLLERTMVPEIDRLYNEKKFKNMGLVLNGSASGNSRYGHKYGYGYGYGNYKKSYNADK